jgi:hypothetical protein
MSEPENFGVVRGSPTEEFGRLRQKINDLISDIRASEIGPLLPLRFLSARPVVLWLPNTRDPDYQARIAGQCRRLAELTADEEGMAAAFEQEAAQTPGWR